MTEGSIDYTSRGGIATITINRPAKRNAMTIAMCEQLHAAWKRLRDSEDRVGVLAAAGEVFTAGADLTDPPKLFWKAIPHLGVDIGKPVIAAVDGKAIGLGMGLLTFCDLCVASPRASFLYPEAQIGVAMGLISTLVNRVPHKFAMELMLTGTPIGAQRAYEMGFVNRLAKEGEALQEAMKLAEPLTRSAPLVVAFLQRMSHRTLEHNPIENMYRAQREAGVVADSEDAREGLTAFREKRAPLFQGR